MVCSVQRWGDGTDQRGEGLAHHPRLEPQRLCCTHRAREGSPRARIGWRGVLEGSGGPAQPPAHHWAKEVEAIMSECLRAASLRSHLPPAAIPGIWR